MASTDSLLAVDVGTESLKMAQFKYTEDDSIILENFAFNEYGKNVDDENKLTVFADAFKQIFAENSFTAKKVYLSISGQSSFTRFVKLPPVEEGESKIQKIIEYEARQNVPFPMNEVMWDYQLCSKKSLNKTAAGEELDENDVEDEDEDIEVMFIVVKNDVIDSISSIIESHVGNTELIEVAPISSYNAARANGIGTDDCSMILNIGAKSSSLIFADGGKFFVRNIPIAGNSITQQISKEFGIPMEDADEMKRRFGFVALGGAYEEPDSEVSATVSKIVRNIMTRLHGEINRSINVYRSQQKGKKPEKLYLAGGSSVMAFTPRFFSEKMKMPVEYFNPFQVVQIDPEIDREELAGVAHMFSEIIGLALRKATPCPIEISLLPKELKKYHNLKRKQPFFYASVFSFVLCLVITLWGFSRQEAFESERAKKAEAKVKSRENLAQKVSGIKYKLDQSKKAYKKASGFISKRSNWIQLLNEIQKILPDNMWLTELKVGNTIKKEIEDKGSLKYRRRRLFRRGDKGAATLQKEMITEKIENITLVGHALSEKTDLRGLKTFDKLKNNIEESDFFDSIPSAQEKFIPYVITKNNNNITNFTITVKLKKALIK